MSGLLDQNIDHFNRRPKISDLNTRNNNKLLQLMKQSLLKIWLVLSEIRVNQQNRERLENNC